MTQSSWQQEKVGDSNMRMHISIPEGDGPFPALVLMQHQGGVDEFMTSMTARFAEAGYVALAPDLYHRDGPDCQDDGPTRRARLADRRIIADVDTSIAYLQRHNAVDGQRVGIVGFCMGGRLVFLMAAVNASLKAAVAYYAGNTFRAWGRDLPTPFERIVDLHCPLLGHFGDDDKNPSPEDREKLAAELKKHNKAFEFHNYPNAGHAFMDHTKESYRKAADEASWPRTMAFLEKQLGK